MLLKYINNVWNKLYDSYFWLRIILFEFIIIIIQKIGKERLGEQFTPYQSEDNSRTIPTYRKKEYKVKATEDIKGASSFWK